MERLEDAEIIEKIKQRVLDSGVGTRAEINIHSGGFDHFYDLTVELLQDKSGGRVIGLTGAAFDITQRKLSEEQARQHQAELTHVARLSVAGEMASGLAHELSQPLMIVEMSAKNCLHHIQAHRGHSEDLMIRMEQIVEQGHRALEIIRRMRNFTRKTKLQRTQVDINMLIRDITCFIETEVKRNRINLQFKLADSLPAVFADAIQIQQVVTNLMRNAIEAMQNTEAGKRQLVIQTTPAESDSIEVEIGDTGPGLPAEVESQLFHPFFTTKPNGMGLGLSISKSIIEGHGGRLWATPNLPRGVTFHFTLPVVTQNYTNGELAGTIS
jgi:C4-dicarboxylate-specific signal transduction histidine kinase